MVSHACTHNTQAGRHTVFVFVCVCVHSKGVSSEVRVRAWHVLAVTYMAAWKAKLVSQKKV